MAIIITVPAEPIGILPQNVDFSKKDLISSHFLFDSNPNQGAKQKNKNSKTIN